MTACLSVVFFACLSVVFFAVKSWKLLVFCLLEGVLMPFIAFVLLMSKAVHLSVLVYRIISLLRY